MNEIKNCPKRIIALNVITCLIFIILTVFSVANSSTDDPPTTDDDQYVTMGYNIQKYRTFSMDKDDTPGIETTAFREPGYPAYIALSIFLSPRLRAMDIKELYSSGLKQLRYLQIPLVVIIAFLTMFIIYTVTKNIYFSYAGLFLMGASQIIEVTANHLFSENLATILLLTTSVLLYKIFKSKKIIYFILLGISLALLVLTKAIFMYFAFIIFILFVIFMIKDRLNLKKIIAGTLLFLFSYSIIAGAWMYRNYRQFGDFFITNGGGVILYTRAGKDTMTNKEYLASYIYWLPGEKVKESLLNRMMDPEDYARLDRSNSFSIHRMAQDLRSKMTEDKIAQGYSRGMADLLVDKELRKMGAQIILKHPFRHIITTLPIALRGIFIEVGYRYTIINNNFLLIQFDTIFFINIILFFCFFYVLVLLFKKRKWHTLMIFIPSMYLYGLNAFMTQDKPRYNIPILPLLLLSAIMLSVYFFQKIKRKGKSLEINNTNTLL